jgi:Ca-activated chloride channel family protein
MAVKRATLWLLAFAVSGAALAFIDSRLATAKTWYWQDLFFSRDQQGLIFFQQGRYSLAAQRFENLEWKATAYYAAEAFGVAAAIWADIPGPQAHFKRANALAHLEDYSGAADGYRLALRAKPDWQVAKENLQLVLALAVKPKPTNDYDGQQATEIGADEIVFSNDKKRMDQAQDEMILNEGGLSSAEINALWMRRLQSRPADFLRLKFHYQLEVEQ